MLTLGHVMALNNLLPTRIGAKSSGNLSMPDDCLPIAMPKSPISRILEAVVIPIMLIV